MARVKRGVTAHKRHKRLLKAAEGRKGTKSKLIKPAREALLHALAYATRDRKQRKRQMRELWIIRINAAARQNGLTYGQFIHGLKKAEDRDRPQDPGRPRGPRQRRRSGASSSSPRAHKSDPDTDTGGGRHPEPSNVSDARGLVILGRAPRYPDPNQGRTWTSPT